MSVRAMSIRVCLMLLGMAIYGNAVASVTVSAPVLPGILDRAHGVPGPYNILLDKITSLSEQDVEIIFAPSSRASKSFLEGKTQCLLPANKEHLPDPESGLVSEQFNEARVHIFSATGTAGYPSLSELAGQRVSMRRGYMLNKAGVTIPDSVYFVQVNSIDQSIGLMDRQRIDAFVAYTPDAFAVFKQSGRTEFVYRSDSPLIRQSEHVVCHATPANRDFMTAINRAIQQVLSEPEFRRALDELEQGAAIQRSGKAEPAAPFQPVKD